MKKEYRRVVGGSIPGGIVVIILAFIFYGSLVVYFALGIEKDSSAAPIVLGGVAPVLCLAFIALGIFLIVQDVKRKTIIKKGTKRQCQVLELFARHVRYSYVDSYHMVATYKGDSGRLYKVNYLLSKELYQTLAKGYVFDCIVYKEDCSFELSDVSQAHR